MSYGEAVACVPLRRRHARKVETVLVAVSPLHLHHPRSGARPWRRINGTFGVDRLITYGGEPQPVPYGVVESLIEAVDPEGNVQFDFHLKEGQTVRVTSGPFAVFVGELEHLDDNGRVRVLLEIMGGKMRVALPQTLVAPS